MSNSSLVTYTRISPNTYGKRTHSIDRITPHCMAVQWTEQQCLENFSYRSRQASCNYAIGKTGGVGLCLGEDMWSWCSSSASNDNRAITIECASNSYHPYKMNKKVYNKLVDLCEDICRRNGKKKLLWMGTDALNYTPKADEMVLTAHRWFKAKACPGDWFYGREGKFAAEVTRRLSDKIPYKVKIVKAVNVRKRPTGASKKVMTLYPEGVYTIVKRSKNKKWGKLKSGAGWIKLSYTKKV